MNYINIYIILFTLLFNICKTSAQTLNEMCGLSLPVVVINTVNNEIPTCENVYAPDYADGIGRTNATKVPCSITIRLHDKILYESGEYKEDNSGAKIKIRGNTTSTHPQKPYKLKLEKKADLLLRGNDKVYKDKEWALLYENELKTFIGLTLNTLVDMPYKPAFIPVNVFMNEQYEGLYYLVESIKRNNKCRIKVDKETGFIWEYDVYWWQNEYYIPCEFDTNIEFTIKYPEEEDLTSDKKSYSESWLKNFQYSIFGGYSESYLCLDTCARWILGQDLLGNSDGGGSNLYFVKEDNKTETKAYIPTLWDFDGMFGKVDDWSNSHKWNNSFFYYMFEYQNTAFDKAFCKEWLNMKENGVTESLIDTLYSFANSDLGKDFEKSQRLTSLLYARSDTTWSITEQVEEYEDWFRARQAWIDNKIYHMIEWEKKLNSLDLNKTFDVLGRKIPYSTKGIKIVDGMKTY